MPPSALPIGRMAAASSEPVLARAVTVVVSPSAPHLPWWVISESRRVPGTSAGDYAEYAKLMFAGPNKTIGETISCRGPLWDRLMRPFLLAALNTEPKQASARLAGAVLKETLAKGGQAYRPRFEQLETLFDSLSNRRFAARTLHGCRLGVAPKRLAIFGSGTFLLEKEPGRAKPS